MTWIEVMAVLGSLIGFSFVANHFERWHPRSFGEINFRLRAATDPWRALFGHLLQLMKNTLLEVKSKIRRFGMGIALITALSLGLTSVHAQGPDKEAAKPEAVEKTASGAAASAPETSSSGAAAGAARRWLKGPRVFGHLSAEELGIVINTDDPYSVEVGQYYAKARGIPDNRVLRVQVPLKANLNVKELAALRKQVDRFFGPHVQALALAWRLPYGVECNSITGALTMGYEASLCSDWRRPPRRSTYFGSSSNKPYSDHQMRLTMLLAAKDVASAKALIDRGVRSDGTLGLKGALPVAAHFVTTSDSVRSLRQQFFPPAGFNKAFGLDVHLDQTDALKNAKRVVLYQTGKTSVEYLDTIDFVPGAVGDHLTSYGGMLDDSHGHMNVLSWIDAGATASYGTTSEPGAFWQKFPHPQVFVIFYVQGASVIEAYWKSVAWPQQGLFVGEPLAAPFAH